MGLAAVGGTVAYSFPSIIVPQNLIKETLVDLMPIEGVGLLTAKGYNFAPRGLAYLIGGSSRVLQGIETGVFYGCN